MPIAVDLTVSPEERRQLARILGCTDDSLDDALTAFATAALQEYVQMFLGQRVLTRGSDILNTACSCLRRPHFRAGYLMNSECVPYFRSPRPGVDHSSGRLLQSTSMS